MSGIDFLKSCTTNVRVVEDIFQTQYSLYQQRNGNISHRELLPAIAQLRTQHVLCVAVKGKLWLFGSIDLELRQRLETQDTLELENEGTVQNSTEESVADGHAIKDIFLQAIEGSIAFNLAQQQGVMQVGSWQWIFSSVRDDGESEEETSTLATLHTNLTDDGSLYISTTTHECSLRPINIAVDSPDIILAPSGHNARLLIGNKDQVSEEQQMKKTIVRDEVWRRLTMDFLAAGGLNISSEDEWITIELSEGMETHRTEWPARLCLSARSYLRAEVAQDWRYWFPGAASHDVQETYHHPLEAAEQWFKAASSRAETTAEIPNTAENIFTTTAMLTDSPLATSPPFSQRTIDHQAAMSGIYPTPPDGLMPAQLMTQQPEQGNDTSTQFLSSDDNVQTSQRHQSIASSVDVPNYQPAGLGSLAVDDLFGDIGEMDDFATNEVGDADFDYFDEPDDIAPAESGRMERVHAEHNVDMMGDEEMADNDASEQSAAVQPSDSNNNEAYTVANTEEPSTVPGSIRGSHEGGLEVMPSATGGDEISTEEPEKPLSPFGIRERLLPPPIPASANMQQTTHPRRSSTFDALTFNDGLTLSAKYAGYGAVKHSTDSLEKLDISLPSKRKRQQAIQDADSGVDDLMESSEEDSSTDLTSMSENEDGRALPPRLPWEPRKRKRDVTFDAEPLSAVDSVGEEIEETESSETMYALCATLVGINSNIDGLKQMSKLDEGRDRDFRDLPAIEELHELDKLSLVYIAQIIGEQAVTATTNIVSSPRTLDRCSQNDQSSITQTVEALLTDVVDRVLSNSEECNVAKLALVKEPPSRTPTNSGRTPHAPNPRTPIREGSMQSGPDYFAIPPPYVRMQRGAETWELLPPALSFWSALGLGPASGAKDVSAICIIPRSEDLDGPAKEFMMDLGRAYEGWKLGSFDVSGPSELSEEMEEVEGGILSVSVTSSTFSMVIREYATLCSRLGKALANVGHSNPDRTIVVCFVNPFEGYASAQSHLCACFWLLYEAYRDNVLKAHKNTSRSDLVLQILPVSLIASPHGMTMLDIQQIGSLAAEVYDRSPPSPRAAAADSSSALPIYAAPAVELASLPPKRIAFQLSIEPPSDLLHEGSILHLAYAVSRDGMWVTACWSDSTGRNQRMSSVCLRGRSFKDVAIELWESTLEIVAAREVLWRVFIVAADHDINESIRECWRNVVGMKPRKQMLHVTLLGVDDDANVRLSPSPPVDEVKTTSVTTPGGGFLTPASTPQGANFTVSPEASSQNNAPPTPVSNDATANVVESDPDAHLIDIADESWGMLVAPSIASRTTASESSTASGLVFRRGDGHNSSLETLSVDLYWEIRVRSNGLVEDVPPKQAQSSLRDVLRMFRNLTLLGKVRSLSGRGDEDNRTDMLPIHVLSAVKGATALGGLLRQQVTSERV